MKKNIIDNLTKRVAFLFFMGLSSLALAQQNPIDEPKSTFWQDVQFGGGLGLGIGSGFTNISIAPSAIYNFNQYVSAGVGVQYSYLKQRDFFSSSMYGGSLIGLINPIEEIQLSVELEQLRVNLTDDNSDFTDDFWNTGLFLGAGYRTNNITIGARYNVLFVDDKGVYGDAFMPFIRVFF
jgi:long-subunit fatty acid transport protein